jgi:hypothetical protein
MLFLFADLHADYFTPKASLNICFDPLFPSNQQMYGAGTFYANNNGSFSPKDSLFYIRDFIKLMPGFSIDGKIGDLFFLNLAMKLKLEYFFSSFDYKYYDELDGNYISNSIDMSLLKFQSGVSASFKIADKIVIEPEVAFLCVRSYFNHHLQDFDLPFSINKVGIYSELKFLYQHTGNIDLGLTISYSAYSEIKEMGIDPFLKLRFSKYIGGYLGVNYDLLSNAIMPKIGFNVNLF